MDTRIQCQCGKGIANTYDDMCRFCREKTVRRAEAKSVGVSRRGDGLSVDGFRVLAGEVNRKDVYL
jgi:hypothetical protein